MNARVLVIATLVAACGSPKPRPAVAVADAEATFERELSACKKMVPPTPVPPRREHALGGDMSAVFDFGVTIRVLSNVPFLFQHAEPGTRARAMWFWRQISDGDVDGKVAVLPFGAVAKVHFHEDFGKNHAARPRLSFIEPGVAGAVPAADAALLADWSPKDRATHVEVYADGHAFVVVPQADDPVEVTLSQAEFDDLLDSFARAGFDRLPESAFEADSSGQVALICQRYRQVDLEGHAQALAPVVAAFEHIRARALAQARPRRDAGHEPAPGTP